MSKVESLLQPGREHLEKRKNEIEALLKGAGREERHRPGRKAIVNEREDLKKELTEIMAMIKAQQKFDKRIDPMIEQRKALRKELMTLPKSKLADLYLNLRFSEAMIQNYHLPHYKRGLEYERELLANQKKSRDSLKKNNREKVEAALLQAGITVTSKTKPKRIIDQLHESNKTLPLSERRIIPYLKEIIKSR